MTAERLRELLHYDPETGLFTWKVNRAYNAQLGRVAGARAYMSNRVRDRFYVRLRIDNKAVYAHVAAVIWMTGARPAHRIDHKNRNGEDNRWANLRYASHANNCANTGPRKHNKLGVKGVRLVRGRFIARIVVAGKNLHLGCFASAAEAASAYDNAAREVRGEFAGVNTP